MARVDQAPDERDQEPLKLDSLLDCPECETTFEFVFTAQEGIYDKEDLIEAPVAEVRCPECGCTWTAEYGGWVAREDAG